MLHFRRRTALAAGISLLVCAVLSACREENQPAPGQVSALQVEPVTMVIQMTGLLLILPPKQSGGETHILMPRKAGHRGYIGFRQETPAGCNEPGDIYRPDLQICYISMDGWSLAPVGVTGGSNPTIPRGVLNLTRGSGGQTVDTTSAKNQIRSLITLASGRVTDSCGVANWTFDPVGEQGPEKVELVNVLEWQIPNLSSETLALVLRRRNPGSPAERHVTLHANEGREIELLILHVTKDEADEFTGESRRSASDVPADTSPIPALDRQEEDSTAAERVFHQSRSAAVRAHFNAFYEVVQSPHTRRRMPTRPRRTQKVCPITVLNLEELFEDDTHQSFWWGIRTYTCIMASAEQS